MYFPNIAMSSQDTSTWYPGPGSDLNTVHPCVMANNAGLRKSMGIILPMS